MANEMTEIEELENLDEQETTDLVMMDLDDYADCEDDTMADALGKAGLVLAGAAAYKLLDMAWNCGPVKTLRQNAVDAFKERREKHEEKKREQQLKKQASGKTKVIDVETTP